VMWMFAKVAHDGAMDEPRQNKAMPSWVDLDSHSYEVKDVWMLELTPDDYFLAEICTKLEILNMRGLGLSEHPEAYRTVARVEFIHILLHCVNIYLA
jgi:hypothetical protein